MKNTVPGEPIQHKYPSMCMADIIMRPITEDGILDLAGDGAIPIIGVVITHTTDTDGATPTLIPITDMEAIMVMLTIEGEVITAIPWLEHIIEDEVTTITAVVEELITIEEEITALQTTIIQELNLVEDHNQILET